MPGHKITLLEENMWVLRETATFKDGTKQVQYYMTPSTWAKAPTMGTIFHDEEVGLGHLDMYRKRDMPKKGWMDGRTCVYDVVPLYGEILTSPNAKHIEVKKP